MGSTVFELQIWHHMGAYGDEEFLSDFARIIHKMKFIWMTIDNLFWGKTVALFEKGAQVSSSSILLFRSVAERSQ